jgi:hypothetical protein
MFIKGALQGSAMDDDDVDDNDSYNDNDEDAAGSIEPDCQCRGRIVV